MNRLLLADLEAAPRTLDPAFTLSLDSREFVIREVLRWLPGKRLTARVAPGQVLKLFLGERVPSRLGREVAGLDAFEATGLATPQILERGAGWLLFEELPGARHAGPGDVADLAAGLAALHRGGFVHGDLHLGNFLVSGGAVHFIDGDSVQQKTVTPEVGLEELAVLLAQFPVSVDVTRAALEAYQGSGDVSVQSVRVRDAREKRVDHYLAKSRRSCTEFEVVRQPSARLVSRREQLAVGEAVLARMEAVFGPDSEFLKQGRSATVVRVRLDGEPWIVKRYNIKGFAHRLRRIFKRRPRIAWEAALTLEFLGIPTARPVALVETGSRWWPGTAYLVCEDLGDQDLAGLTRNDQLEERHVEALLEMLTMLKRARLVHGDLKSTNFLVHGSGFALIDVDGLKRKQEPSPVDAARLLANWPEGSAVRARVHAAIVRSPEFEGLVQ